MSFALMFFGGLNVYLLGKGYWWLKYAMSILFVLSYAKPSTWAYLAKLDTISLISTIFRTGINLWILWLLFKVPNQLTSNNKGPDLPEPL
ncbi:hypothetical protein [Mucilaginibacter antarcticus]|uniref:Uncharacterized protein n=1 Tax=Mucilaginibacter antarcticus TaxID=1855725 RepID=A0ABW5XN72_9SPHI